MRLHLFAGLLIAVAVVPVAAADKDDKDKIQGAWHVVSGEDDGKNLARKDVKGTEVVITADKITVMENGKKRVMTYKLDPDKKPRHIDLTTVEGSDEGKMAPGIYDLDANRLRICFAEPGGERPKDFDPKKGSKEMRFVMRRDRK